MEGLSRGTTPPSGKRQCLGPHLSDILKVARDMLGGELSAKSATMTEDRRFREMFGCGPFVALALWTLISKEAMLPGSSITHMMWALMFLKQYPKEAPLRSMGGGNDEKTMRKWKWKMISAIADLEPFVVSFDVELLYLVASGFLTLSWCFHCRLIGMIARRETLATIAWYLLTGQTFEFKNMAVNSTATNLRLQAYDTKLLYAFSAVRLFGSMAPTSLEIGMI